MPSPSAPTASWSPPPAATAWSRVWRRATGAVRTQVSPFKGNIFAMAFHPESKTLFVGGADPNAVKQITVEDADKEVRIFEGHAQPVTCLAVTQDGKMLATGCSDRTIRLWDASSAQSFRTLQGHSEEVRPWPSAQRRSTPGVRQHGSDRPPVGPGPGRAVREFAGHEGAVWSAVFSPDGKKAASGGADKLVHVWDVASTRELNKLTGHKLPVTAVLYSPDGKSHPVVQRRQDPETVGQQHRPGSPVLRRPHRRGHVGGVQSRRRAHRLRLGRPLPAGLGDSHGQGTAGAHRSSLGGQQRGLEPRRQAPGLAAAAIRRSRSGTPAPSRWSARWRATRPRSAPSPSVPTASGWPRAAAISWCWSGTPRPTCSPPVCRPFQRGQHGRLQPRRPHAGLGRQRPGRQALGRPDPAGDPQLSRPQELGQLGGLQQRRPFPALGQRG